MHFDVGKKYHAFKVGTILSLESCQVEGKFGLAHVSAVPLPPGSRHSRGCRGCCRCLRLQALPPPQPLTVILRSRGRQRQQPSPGARCLAQPASGAAAEEGGWRCRRRDGGDRPGPSARPWPHWPAAAGQLQQPIVAAP